MTNISKLSGFVLRKAEAILGSFEMVHDLFVLHRKFGNRSFADSLCTAIRQTYS